MAYALFDRYERSKDRTVLTPAEHGIPSLRMVGHHQTSRAKAPLGEHYHPDCFEFTYIVQGNLLFQVGDESYSLSGGDLFMTLPDEVHSTGNAPLSLHQMYWFQLDASHPERFLFSDPQRAQWIIEALWNLPNRVVRLHSMAEVIFREIFVDLDADTETGRLQAGYLMDVLLCQILKDSRDAGQAMSQDISLAVAYIHGHLRERIALEEVAGAAMLSVPRLKEKFKAETGTSPRNYINFHKIELAKKLLLEGMSVTDAAMELGFSGSDYFSVVFRRYTLSSPSEFVARARQDSPEPEAKARP